MSPWTTLSVAVGRLDGQNERGGTTGDSPRVPRSRPCAEMRPDRNNGQKVVMIQVAAAMRYRADITAGALKLPQSRIIADLLLRKTDAAGWKDAIITQNILQSRNPESARRLTRLIRGRLETMGPDLWKLVRDGKGIVATHAVFASAVKHSPLLGDFLRLVVDEQYRLFNPILSSSLWTTYLEGCRERDPEMPQWHESTRKRLRSSVFQMLAQAGYIENTRSLKLQAVHIAEPVLRYLRMNHEEYVLRCIEVTP